MAIIQKRKYIQGQVNPPHNSDDSDKLQVGDTESLKLKLENNTLTGEVSWKSQLGYTADKAYPGNDGVKNRNSIESIVKDVRETTKTIEDLKRQIQILSTSTNSQIKSISTKLETFDNLVTTDELLQKVSEEALRAINAEKNLIDQIDNEISKREDVDKDIKNQISRIKSEIDIQFNTLTASIKKETQEVKDDIEILSKELETEKQRALSSESTIRYKLNQQRDEFETELADIDKKYQKIEEESKSRFQKIDQVLDIYSKKFEEIFSLLDAHDKRITDNYRELKAQIVSINHFINDLTSKYTHLLHYYEELRSQLDNLEVLHDVEIEELNTRVNNEINRSTSVDADLQSTIVDLNSQFNLLQQNVENSIDDIQTSIQTFEHQFHALDQNYNDLKQYIDQKFLDLESQIISLDAFVPKKSNDGEDQLYGQFGTETTMYRLDAQPSADSVVKRDPDGNIIVSELNLTSDSAVPKKFVENLLQDLSDNINSIIDKKIDSLQYEFIDGGTAPINK